MKIEKNKRKKIAYKIFSTIGGVAFVVLLYLVACIAEFPDWSAQQWAFHFLAIGITAGITCATWFAATLVGWTEEKKED